MLTTHHAVSAWIIVHSLPTIGQQAVNKSWPSRGCCTRNYYMSALIYMLDSTNSDPNFINIIITCDEFWVYRYNPEIKLIHHFPYNENPTRALNTTSLKCCLPSTDIDDKWEKFTHAYEGSTSLQQVHFSKIHQVFEEKKKLDSFLIEQYIGLITSDYGVHKVGVTVCGVQHVLGVGIRAGNQIVPSYSLQ